MLEDRTLLSTSGLAVPLAAQNAHPLNYAGSPVPPFTPAQIRHAYGFDQITFKNGTVVGNGAGQTIAIVDAYYDPTIFNDVNVFDSTFGLPSVRLSRAYYTTTSDPGWSMETALDVEWAHAIAPGANILLVEAASSSLNDLLTAVNWARQQPGVSTVSMSWGGGEWSSEAYYDSYFTTPSGHAGVTFVASSGDSGSGAGWPAISPNVISVGGTSLALTAAGNYGSETSWSGSGGGISSYEAEPAYQKVLNIASSGRRGNPDVAYDANPNTGFYVYDTNNGGSGWWQIGGTSAGAPQWAALVAIADQGRALAGQKSLDGPSQTLYALYRMAQSNYTAYFHDVTSGSNGGFRATVGYDFVTGLGSPIANRVVSALVGWTGSSSTGKLTTAAVSAGTAKPHAELPGGTGTLPGAGDSHMAAVLVAGDLRTLLTPLGILPAGVANNIAAPTSIASFFANQAAAAGTLTPGGDVRGGSSGMFADEANVPDGVLWFAPPRGGQRPAPAALPPADDPSDTSGLLGGQLEAGAVPQLAVPPWASDPGALREFVPGEGLDALSDRALVALGLAAVVLNSPLAATAREETRRSGLAG